MRKILFYLIGLLTLSAIVFGTDITDCTDISTPGVYHQVNTITPDGGNDQPCIDISAPNVHYFGNGFSIENARNADSDIFYISSSTNISISNLNIDCNLNYNWDGIQSDNSISNSSFFNISFINCDESIDLNSDSLSNNSNIHIYNLSISSSWGAGIEITYGSFLNIHDIYVSPSYLRGITLTSQDSNFTNLNIGAVGTTQQACLLVGHNNVYNNCQCSGGKYAMILKGYNQNLYNSQASSGVTSDIQFGYTHFSIFTSDLSFLYNVSFSDYSVFYGTESWWIYWFYDVNISNTLNEPVNAAQIYGYNSNNIFEDSGVTDQNGITRLTLPEYYNNAGSITYFNNYTTWADHPMYSRSENHSINMSTNVFDTFNLTNRRNVWSIRPLSKFNGTCTGSDPICETFQVPSRCRDGLSYTCEWVTGHWNWTIKPMSYFGGHCAGDPECPLTVPYNQCIDLGCEWISERWNWTWRPIINEDSL